MATVAELVTLCNTYLVKPGNESGGWLHLVLDDGNLDDESIRFCQVAAEREGDAAGVAICKALLELSSEDREAAWQLTHP